MNTTNITPVSLFMDSTCVERQKAPLLQSGRKTDSFKTNKTCAKAAELCSRFFCCPLWTQDPSIEDAACLTATSFAATGGSLITMGVLMAQKAQLAWAITSCGLTFCCVCQTAHYKSQAEVV